MWLLQFNTSITDDLEATNYILLLWNTFKIDLRQESYLIFVTNAANAVRVKFLAECKKIPEKREKYCFGLRLYHNSDHVNVLFYTKCAILHRYQCFILHLVFDFTLGV